MMDWRDLDTWRRMDPDATFALTMQLEDRLRAVRGGCKMLSQGDACDCGLCKRDREIERLQTCVVEIKLMLAEMAGRLDDSLVKVDYIHLYGETHRLEKQIAEMTDEQLAEVAMKEQSS